MQKKVYFLMGLSAFVFVFGVNQKLVAQTTDYETFIFRIEMSYPLEMVEKELGKITEQDIARLSKEDALKKAILLFKKGLLTLSEEDAKEASDAFNYVYTTHTEYQLPVLLAYRGAGRAAIAGTLVSPNPIPKLELLEEGTRWLDEAIEAQKASGDTDQLVLGYLYFLRGRTMAAVPSFLNSSKDAKPNLKQALSHYKKAKNVPPTLIANIYYAYAQYYLNQGKIKTALKNMERAKKYADPYFKQEIEEKIQSLKG